MREVLCVLRAAPLDPSTGSVRTRRLARRICDGRDATVVVFDDVDQAARAWLADELGAPLHVLGATATSRTAAVGRALVHPRHAWPPVRLDVLRAQAEIGRLLSGCVPEVVWCAGGEAWLALPRNVRTRAVVDLVDLPSRNRGELARVAVHRLGRRVTGVGGVDASAFGVFGHLRGGLRNRQLERYAAGRAGALVVASPHEAHGRSRFRVVRTGADVPGPLGAPDDPYPVPHFVLPGNFEYPPHQDAAEWFALYVVPPLRRLVPACRVVFAGPGPSWMAEFGTLHGIDVTGPLVDPGTVVDRRSIVVTPVRAGSGTIVEIVDAWARGVPVVSTSRGVEGLGAHPGEDVLVADDAAGFAAACAELAHSPDLRRRLATAGRARYEAEFTWDGIGDDLVAWLATARG